MNRQDSALRANLRVAVGLAAFTSIGVVLAGQANWDVIGSVWLGWLSLAVMIGVLRGGRGGM